MDPLSVIASCIGICDGLSKVGSLARKYIHSDEKTAQELRRLVAKLSRYKGIIEGIQFQAEFDKDSAERLKALAHVDGPLQTCNAATQKLETRLSNLPHRVVFGKVVFGKVVDDETAQYLQMFDDTLPILQFALDADQRIINSKVLEYVKSIGQQLQMTMARQQTHDESSATQQLMAWLTEMDPTRTYRDCLNGKSTTSGRWFLCGEFESWLKRPTTDRKLLWLRGVSGMGKTTLVSFAIDFLKRELHFSPRNGQVVACFYCSSAVTDTQSATVMTRSIIRQLCDQIPQARAIVHALRERLRDEPGPQGRDPPLRDLEKALWEICALACHVVLVLDAPNESEQSELLIEVLDRCRSSTSNVKILVSSTPALDLFHRIDEKSIEVVDMPASSVDADIADYISLVMGTEKRLQRLPWTVKHKVQRTIAAKSKGSFRWAECQINAIVRNARSAAAIEAALDSMAPSLEAHYTEILRQTEVAEARPTRMALLWLAFAIRPLHIDELSEAMGLDESSEFADPSTRLFREGAEEVLKGCRSLINYDASSKAARLAHDSVRQFLLSAQLQQSAESGFFIDPVEDTGFLCSMMINYLNLPALSEGYGDPSGWQVRSRHQNLPLLQYVSDALPIYLESKLWHRSSYAQSVKVGLKRLYASASLPRGGNFGSWVEVTVPWADLSQSEISPIYFVAGHGYTRILKMILGWEGTKNIEKPAGAVGATPLHIACFQGHIDAVRLLLSMGANPNEENTIGESGIQWAHYLDYDEIVELMLAAGADPARLVPFDWESGSPEVASDCSASE
ncbi:hypothetical protein HDK90DRAFT_97662 [Phyllosticta capitalensis]|uniref:Ankyrin repeat protein n=1 Tax=Phyllosticta capitalensis TaxID=121624 RepID=A0ABR1Y9M8_9PEZI